jgi:hypothetical protein
MINSGHRGQVAYSAFRRNAVVQSIQAGVPEPGTGLRLSQLRGKPSLDAMREMLRRGSGAELADDPVRLLAAEIGCNPAWGAWHKMPRLKSKLPDFDTTYQRVKRGERRRYSLDDDCILLPLGHLPAEVVDTFHCFDLFRVFDFAGSEAVLWVRHPVYRYWWPYGTSKPQLDILKACSVSERSAVAEAALAEVCLMHRKDNKTPGNGGRTASKAREFRERQYAHLPAVLNAFQRQDLARYYEEVISAGLLIKGDLQTPHRYWAHNDAVSRYLQMQILDYVRELTGHAYAPTFTSFLAYAFPGDLQRHRDREQAALTLSLLIDYRDEGRTIEDSWQFFLEHEADRPDLARNPAAAAFTVGLGSAVAFQGQRQTHYRERIPRDHESRIICLHFACSDFQGKRL